MVLFYLNEENRHIYRYPLLEHGGMDSELCWHSSELFPDTVDRIMSFSGLNRKVKLHFLGLAIVFDFSR